MPKLIEKEIYASIFISGFFMPVIQVIDSELIYALSQAHKIIIGTAISMAPTFANTMAYFGSTMAIIIGALAIIWIIQDFENGLKMKYKTLIFGMGALVGLYLFWPDLSSLTPAVVSFDVILSSIISIVVVFAGMGLAIFLEKR
ncbi:MAG: hypothetical protein M1125_01980 [Candidatus Marsarchaeota archaeon]|nr:hypothetical protein [Candidatus Marsarchaeota archaeon]